MNFNGPVSFNGPVNFNGADNSVNDFIVINGKKHQYNLKEGLLESFRGRPSKRFADARNDFNSYAVSGKSERQFKKEFHDKHEDKPENAPEVVKSAPKRTIEEIEEVIDNKTRKVVEAKGKETKDFIRKFYDKHRVVTYIVDYLADTFDIGIEHINHEEHEKNINNGGSFEDIYNKVGETTFEQAVALVYNLYNVTHIGRRNREWTHAFILGVAYAIKKIGVSKVRNKLKKCNGVCNVCGGNCTCNSPASIIARCNSSATYLRAEEIRDILIK